MVERTSELLHTTRSKNDYCLFSNVENNEKLYVLSWVDDIVIAGSNNESIGHFEKTHGGKFKIDDRKKLEWFLGMQENGKVTFDREKYIESVIENFGIQYSNPSRTPAENNLKLVGATESETLVDERLYRSLVGSLLYIAKQTRPDIVWIVNVLSRFMDQITNTHWLAGKHVLRYVQATKSLKLVYPRDYTEKAMHTGTEIRMTGDQQRATFSSLVPVGEQLAGKPRSSRLWLSSCEAEYQDLLAAVQGQPSCDPSSARWALLAGASNTHW